MTEDGTHPESTETVPIPPRFWWLKRIGVVVVIWLVALVGLRAWWGYEAGRRLQVEIDCLRAAGGPVEVQDFAPPPLPDAENAAPLYDRVGRMLAGLEAEQVELYGGMRFWDEVVSGSPNEVRELLVATAEARSLTRKARSLPSAGWGAPLRGAPTVLNRLAQARHLAKLLALVVLYDHSIGNDADAVETLADIFALARHTDRRPKMLNHLVAASLNQLSARTIEDISATLEIAGGAPVSGARPAPASREAVGRLIVEILDEGSVAQRFGFVWTCLGERAVDIEAAKAFGFGSSGVAPVSLSSLVNTFPGLLGPVAQLNLIRIIRRETRWIEAAEPLTWPAFAPRSIPPSAPPSFPPSPPSYSVWESLSRPFRYMETFADSAGRQHRSAASMTRMAAIALAIRLYAIDHGRRPERLGELVPEYLASIPNDPYASTLRNIGYRPEGTPPVLYSVNLDGVDDGGKFVLNAYGFIDHYAADLVLFLDGDRRRHEQRGSTSLPTSAKHEASTSHPTSAK
ncbi:MAG: hypothetical protein JXQ73_27825 [Phycisphaerae bacterium]|nr:hypothetical protein [Phycisphaerae bacterium]